MWGWVGVVYLLNMTNPLSNAASVLRSLPKEMLTVTFSSKCQVLSLTVTTHNTFSSLGHTQLGIWIKNPDLPLLILVTKEALV